jgi:hypothetical protein
MEELENKALETATLRPGMWVRYVDDTFVLWLHNKKHLENFHQHLNSQHPAIQFTMERATEQIHVPRCPSGEKTRELCD